MPHSHEIERASTTEGLPIAPSMGPGLESVGAARHQTALDARVAGITVLACGIAMVAAVIAQVLTASIGFITNLAFHHTVSFTFSSPAENHLGFGVLIVPIIGAVIVGAMARWGSAAIRGHGIPEAMEQILFNQSKIPARMVLLKPLSAVISIGTGGPFGAEGPIIATGGALGSLIGQLTKITADERKTLLAAGAAAGMSATFGSPVAAVLLAIELLLFEYRPRSVVPVALASVTAAAARVLFVGTAPAFAVKDLTEPHPYALVVYVLVGGLCGLASVGVTKLVYGIEDLFERLPIHWMWWPALGAIPVGIIGYFAPRTLGVGYDNIEQMVSGSLSGKALAVLCGFKLISWLFSLGSGTSGGTLAPLFTIGGGVGASCAAVIAWIVPWAHVDPRVGALVGMAAMFAGASRALLASVVFAFETTRQPLGLLPLLGGCCASYFVSCTMMKHSIMTEKIARRGLRVPMEYAADFLEQVQIGDVALRRVVTLSGSQLVADVRMWVSSGDPGSDHQGFPVIDGDVLIGVVTRRDLMKGGGDTVRALVKKKPITMRVDASLREAADLMTREQIGRIPVIDKGKLVGIVTRSDLLNAHRERIHREHVRARARSFTGEALVK
jgi:H+/Cl- antiporter ClcA/CBS domain-containing protein